MAKATGKFTDEGIGASNTGKYDFLGDAAVVDDALIAKLERAKRVTASELRNRVGGLLYAFNESGQNEIMFDRLPSWAMTEKLNEDGTVAEPVEMVPLEVEHGRAKGQPITLKSLYSAARSIIGEANGSNADDSNMPLRAVWSEKAEVFALQRTDADFTPTLTPRIRKAKDNGEDADADADDATGDDAAE